MTAPPNDDHAARCWSCGYQLRAIQSTQCPECGRPFDPASPASMNFGRPMGRTARWALSPWSWWPAGFASLACALVWSAVRWPAAGWTFSLPDVQFYARIWEWKHRSPGLTNLDIAYTTGLGVASLAALAVIALLLLRTLAIARYRPPRFQRGRCDAVCALILLLSATTFLGIGVGWPYRAGQRYTTAARDLTLAPDPQPLNARQQLIAIRSALLQSRPPADRIAVLRSLVQRPRAEALPILLDAARQERDPAVQIVMAHLLGLARPPQALPIIEAWLDNPNPDLRAAAIDAIGVMVDHHYLPGRSLPIDMAADPPIPVQRWINEFDDLPALAAPRSFESVLLGHPTPAERQAAARAIVCIKPSSYQFRYAEWGVFTVEETNPATENPPNAPPAPTIADLFEAPDLMAPRPLLNGVIATTRLQRVIYCATDRVLALDLLTGMRFGQPRRVHPRPDELLLIRNLARDADGPVAQNGIGKMLPDQCLTAGYPWLNPRQPAPSPSVLKSYQTAALNGVAVRWQGIIVNPQRLDWMTPPSKSVGLWSDPAIEIASSYLSTAGQTCRILSCDDYSWNFKADDLVRTRYDKRPGNPRFPSVPRPDTSNAMYVEVGGEFGTAGSEFFPCTRPSTLQPFPLTVPPFQLEARLMTGLIAHGLLPSEAAGLLDCWRNRFFNTPGKRFLTLISTQDYDRACPLQLKPQPTERARVGLLLTEIK